MKVIRAFVLSGWQRVLTWNDWLPAQLSASLGTCMAKDWITSRLCSCTGMEMPSDVFLLQELGDVRGLALVFTERTLSLLQVVNLSPTLQTQS